MEGKESLELELQERGESDPDSQESAPLLFLIPPLQHRRRGWVTAWALLARSGEAPKGDGAG